jgi:hypothetical protein
MSLFSMLAGWGLVVLGMLVMAAGFLSTFMDKSSKAGTPRLISQQLQEIGMALIVVGIASYLAVILLKQLKIVRD